MEGTTQYAISKPTPPANEQQEELDLYTIPSSSSWFNWDEIHEIERSSLKEFFNWVSITRTPKIYKEYRDFIINKFREDPSRKLKFTDVRRSLIGDISLIHKVFRLLEKWGLINFDVASTKEGNVGVGVEGEEKVKVRFEEGVPNGIRVSAYLNSSKAVLQTSNLETTDVGEEGPFILPPLASHSDVFRRDLVRAKELVCGNCGDECVSGFYESTKEESIACVKCYKNENYDGKISASDFKFKDGNQGSDVHGAGYWTEEETLLLLESVLKHGDNWDLVSENVPTKNTLECISRLIELPFGELVLDTNNGNTSSLKKLQSAFVESKEPIVIEDQQSKQTNEHEQIKDDEIKKPPLKKRGIVSFADVGDSLMKQVALLSTAVSPHIAAAAAEASITTLCDENQYARLIFDGEKDNVTNVFESNTSDNEPTRLNDDAMETEETHLQSENQDGFLKMKSKTATLRIRAAVATALGAAAARAKLLADQEEREIEHLVATVIETQVKKINLKIKYFEEVELIMEKEYAQIQEIKESVLDEQIDVIRQALVEENELQKQAFCGVGDEGKQISQNQRPETRDQRLKECHVEQVDVLRGDGVE
ncbi:hypothetical protein GIB67_041798 [Kingdonia uniflora]|uniref:SWI/SNF complex subunit SWI3A n=1 Tax=Kingdonia uniflora TaxID=39325 RepID=A0A7J7L5K4_9MAGN|nr:hypothetical protein GIB67_041798 [Kingdonia uniflora]